jgi:cation:H+ antiporter
MADLLFTDIMVNVLVIAISFLGLNWASNLVINNAVKLSTITQLGKTAIGFSLIAFSTSLPELTVAVIASVSGSAAVSVGNVFGSNIFNVCAIIGLAAILLHLRRIKGKIGLKEILSNLGKRTHTNGPQKETNGTNIIPAFAKSELSSIHFGLFIASIVPMILIYIAGATWVVGLVLLFIFVGYMYRLTKVRIPTENNAIAPEERSKLKRYILLTIGGAIGVVLSAYFLVESAVGIATTAGLSQQIIGATIIAVGTSLPELTLDLKAFLRGHPGLAFGDIVGSSFVNITLILGITFFVPALFGTPVTMRIDVFQGLVIFSIITNLLLSYFLSRERVGWQEGLIFLFVYALFIASTLGAVGQQVV